MKIHKIPQLSHAKELAVDARIEAEKKARRQSFANVLKNKLSEHSPSVKFSAHAVARLASRNISLTTNDISKINEAVGKLEQKGGRESLVLMGSLAFIVSVKNNTVITAVDSNRNASGNIFTNIDSALIM